MSFEFTVLPGESFMCEHCKAEYSKQLIKEVLSDENDIKVLPSCMDLLQDIPRPSVWRAVFGKERSQSQLMKRYQEQRSSQFLLKKDFSKTSSKAVILPAKYLPLTFLPDCVIDEIVEGTLRAVPYTVHSTAVLLLADVSGFTAFTETYCQIGMSGIEELIAVLNGYLSALAEDLMSAGADILSFAGDAFLCQWEEKGEDDMDTIIERAFRCSVAMQNSSKQKSDAYGANLRVKIGIASGGITTWFVGSPSEFLHFVISGHTLPNVRSAQELCGPGEIVLTSEVWERLQALNVDVDQHTYVHVNNAFVKVIAYGNVKENEMRPFGSGRMEKFKNCSKRHVAMARAFLIPVTRDLKTREQINYLSELTQVTILFILLPDIDVEEPTDLDVAFDIILASVKNLGGILNKVLLFDKGCTFLAIFGLPGMKHANDPARAILCARDLILSLKKKNILATTGISNGSCFCGIVGHPQRQEYTVIGRRVNLAARLMVGYEEELIVLDAETFYHSRRELRENSFIELEPRHLKGMTNVGTIYAYMIDSEEKMAEPLTERIFEPLPLDIFGMDTERSALSQALEMIAASGSTDIVKMGLLPVLLIVAKSGSGKSYLTYYAVEKAKTLNYKVLACCANPLQKDVPFVTIAFLIQTLIKLKDCETAFDRQQIILQYVNDPYLYLLNHLLDVEFSFPPVTVIGEKFCNAEIERLLKKILLMCCEDSPILVAIDDANFIDPQSWLFLKNLVQESNVFLLLSLPVNFREPCLPVFAMLAKAFSVIKLGPLNKELIAPLICKFWGVEAVHHDVLNYLKKHATRSSVQLEELLLNPSVVRAISITPLHEVEGSRLMSDFYHVQKTTEESVMRKSESHDVKQSKDVKVCDVASGVNLEELSIPLKVQDSVKERLNALQLQERLLLKRAAVLGIYFTQSILEDVSPDMTAEEVASSVKTLTRQHIIESWYGKSEDSVRSSSSRHLTTVAQLTSASPVFSRKSSEHLRFHSDVVRLCILSYMTRDQLNNMNFEIAQKLEKHGMLCLFCKQKKESDWNQRTKKNDSCGMCAGLLPFPKLDLRECRCLSEKAEKFNFISSCYEKAGLKLIPLYYLMKAAQADIENKNPIKALNFADAALKKLHELRGIHISSLTGVDSNFNPIVLKAAIHRVSGEAKLLLGNTYEGACHALKGLEILATDIFDFFGVVSQLDVLHLAFRYSLKECQEIASCLRVACQSYYAARSFTIAYGLAKSYLTMVGEFQSSFIEKLKGNTLFYECQNKEHPEMSQYDIERKLLITCIDRMKLVHHPLSVIEIVTIGETYLSLAQFHLIAGRFERVKEIGFEAYKMLKYVHDSKTILRVLFTLVRSLFYERRWSKCIEVLSRLKDIADQSGQSVAYALYCCESMELMHVGESRAITNDRMLQCMDFLSQWAGKCKSQMRDDAAFYVTSKSALWCLEERSGLICDEKLADELFTQWHVVAVSLKSHNFHTYLSLSALFTLSKIDYIVCQRDVNLNGQAYKETISHILQVKELWKTERKRFPLYETEVKALMKNLKKAKTSSRSRAIVKPQNNHILEI